MYRNRGKDDENITLKNNGWIHKYIDKQIDRQI